MNAISRMSPPQFGHSRGNPSPTRDISFAQAIREVSCEIRPESFDTWLDPAEHDPGKIARLLRPFHPDEMTGYRVSTLVNNVRNDSAKCIEPASVLPAEQQA